MKLELVATLPEAFAAPVAGERETPAGDSLFAALLGDATGGQAAGLEATARAALLGSAAPQNGALQDAPEPGSTESEAAAHAMPPRALQSEAAAVFAAPIAITRGGSPAAPTTAAAHEALPPRVEPALLGAVPRGDAQGTHAAPWPQHGFAREGPPVGAPHTAHAEGGALTGRDGPPLPPAPDPSAERIARPPFLGDAAAPTRGRGGSTQSGAQVVPETHASLAPLQAADATTRPTAPEGAVQPPARESGAGERETRASREVPSIAVDTAARGSLPLPRSSAPSSRQRLAAPGGVAPRPTAPESHIDLTRSALRGAPDPGEAMRRPIERPAFLAPLAPEPAAIEPLDAPLPRPVPLPPSEGAPAMAAHDARGLESRVDAPRVDLPAHAQPLQPLTQRVEWLLSQGGGSARLHLDPPHLGEVQLQVRAVGSDIRISMIAEEAGARVLLEAGREWLVDQFAARDLRVSHFEVQERGAATLDGDPTARGQTGERDAAPNHGGSPRSGDRADNASEAPRDGDRPVGWSPRAGRRIDLRI